jgi:hypothetical protein
MRQESDIQRLRTTYCPRPVLLLKVQSTPYVDYNILRPLTRFKPDFFSFFSSFFPSAFFSFHELFWRPPVWN